MESTSALIVTVRQRYISSITHITLSTSRCLCALRSFTLQPACTRLVPTVIVSPLDTSITRTPPSLLPLCTHLSSTCLRSIPPSTTRSLLLPRLPPTQQSKCRRLAIRVSPVLRSVSLWVEAPRYMCTAKLVATLEEQLAQHFRSELNNVSLR